MSICVVVFFFLIFVILSLISIVFDLSALHQALGVKPASLGAEPQGWPTFGCCEVMVPLTLSWDRCWSTGVVVLHCSVGAPPTML